MKSLPSRPLRSFVEWLRETDDHAEHRVVLISQVEQCLGQNERSREAVVLSNKLERWRYSLLYELGDALCSKQRSLIQALNATANQLRGRGQFPLRDTNGAIHHSQQPSSAESVALELLDPEYPLEPLISQAHLQTAENFSNSPSLQARWPMLLYAPLYVSSHCVNHCNYCGFRYSIETERRHLTLDQVDEQVTHLLEHGFRHLLVVGGEFPSLTTLAYYREIVQHLVDRGIAPAIEIAPQSTADYQELVQAGACGVTLYQETYDQKHYCDHHPRGPKANYHWRLEAQDRAAEAGMQRLGLGVLLGLAEPEKDMLALIRHASYLSQRFSEATIAFSLPRIHDAPPGFNIAFRVTDDDLIRYYCTLRIAFPKAPLVLSTRESITLRNRLAQICITQMSAGSSTTPGGYGDHAQSGSQQFLVSDHRSVGDVKHWLSEQGFPIAWSFAHSK